MCVIACDCEWVFGGRWDLDLLPRTLWTRSCGRNTLEKCSKSVEWGPAEGLGDTGNLRQLSLSSSHQSLSQHPSPPDSIHFKVSYLTYQSKGFILSWSLLAPCPKVSFLFSTILNCKEMFPLPGGFFEGFDHIWFIMVTLQPSQCLRCGRSSVFTR